MSTVHTGTISFTYTVQDYEMEDGRIVYDWFASNGDESQHLFDTIEEAINDVAGRY